MKTESQRIAIAEACGYSNVSESRPPKNAITWMHGTVFGTLRGLREVVPDYPNSLDACAEFERLLERESTDGNGEPIDGYGDDAEYARQLLRITRKARPYESIARMYKATALQRCEAFLRTIGKWEDSP